MDHRIHPDLLSRITPEDFFFLKDTKSAFGSKNTDESLCFDDVVGQGYDNIIVVGTSVIDCVQRTIEDMAQAGLKAKIILPRDACSPSPAFTNGQDSYLSNLTVCSTERLKEYLSDEKPLQHFPFKENASAGIADGNKVHTASDSPPPKQPIADETLNLG